MHGEEGVFPLAARTDYPENGRCATKRVGRGQKFEISEDPKADMERIQKIYEDMHLTARHPKNYVTH